ncbi:phasin family protein [Ferrimonas lipolytica]|uniref:Phasin family protein n=1 Tax=Ferrimonas lipolytica TaxID=2724191 RepID=A0A6H1UCK5_9GAMM|nr:phasin family protein [Ferrimonas lipolytica]QIZ75542.1 phasin family protein [Ferrimonas lipolytica]
MDIRTQGQEWLEDSEQMARNIWLAGLGVYGKTLEEGRGLEGKTTELFDSLVEQGREVESRTRDTIETQVASTNRNVEKRVQDLFTKMSGVDPERIETLNSKVDKLTKMVEKMADA